MIANGWRWETIGRIDSEAESVLTPGYRDREQRQATEGNFYRNVSAAEEGETFDRASIFCPTRDPTAKQWKKISESWRAWATDTWSSGRRDYSQSSWYEQSSQDDGGWHDRWWSSPSSSWWRK